MTRERRALDLEAGAGTAGAGTAGAGTMVQVPPTRRASDPGSPDRDRYADLLRIVSIALVVLGHWGAAIVLVQDGQLVVGRLHALLPWTQWATWLFQVMPVFFIVGGFVNARSWVRAHDADAQDDGQSWSAWLRRRAQRLLSPLPPLLVFWALVVPVLLVVGPAPEYVRMAGQAAFVPLWFLGVYLVVIALVPLTWRLHRRFGWLAVFAFLLAAAAVDALARFGPSFIGYANVIFVWAGIHQAGYFWHEARLPREPIVAVAWAVVALSVLVALVTFGGYPVSMVTVEEGARSNVAPPTIALFALAFVQLGIAAAARGPVSRWLERPRVWAALVAAGSVTFTVFLWHMTALVLVAVLAYLVPLGLLTPEIDARWWALRPLWFALCALVLAVLVAVFKRFDRGMPEPSQAARVTPVRTTVGLLATLGGIAGLVRWGLYDPESPWSLAAALASLVVGLGLLGALNAHIPAREPRSDGPPPRLGDKQHAVR